MMLAEVRHLRQSGGLAVPYWPIEKFFDATRGATRRPVFTTGPGVGDARVMRSLRGPGGVV